MNDKWQWRRVCTLLDLTRKAYWRHLMIEEHLRKHFDVDYDVFTPDPLFSYAADLLGELIRDRRLLYWWLTHNPEDVIYKMDDECIGQTLDTPLKVWNYYQASMGREQ